MALVGSYGEYSNQMEWKDTEQYEREREREIKREREREVRLGSQLSLESCERFTGRCVCVCVCVVLFLSHFYSVIADLSASSQHSPLLYSP